MDGTASHAVAEVRELVTVVTAAVRDIFRLLGLEAQILLRAAAMMAVLGIVLGLVLAAAWVFVAVAVATALQLYTGLGMVGAALVTAALHLLLAGGIVLALRRLAQRLSFPETRSAIQTLWPAAEKEGGAP
jgi:hypothetical protein